MTKLLRDTGHSDEESELEARGREPQLESESQLAPAQRTTRVVLDTSVLIADPNCLLAYPNCDIVIPLTIIEELDGLKSRPDDVGRAARAAGATAATTDCRRRSSCVDWRRTIARGL